MTNWGAGSRAGVGGALSRVQHAAWQANRRKAPIAPARGLRAQLRHAFAVEKPGPAEPAPETRAALAPLLRGVRKRGLVGPAVLFPESVAPLNAVGARAPDSLWLIATAVLDPVRYATLVKRLERRGSMAWVVGELGLEGGG